jgi:hypothetical protein
MKKDFITVKYNLSKTDLICCVCLECISLPIIQCSSGNHFVCKDCHQKINGKCPVCRTSRLFHNQHLERVVADQMVSCTNIDCKEKVFKWGLEEHVEDCIHSEGECFVCQEPVSMFHLITHLKYECNVDWVERNDGMTSGSVQLVLDSIENNTLKIKLTNKQVVIMIQDSIIFLNWTNNKYSVEIVSCQGTVFIQYSINSSTTVVIRISPSECSDSVDIPSGLENVQISTDIDEPMRGTERFLQRVFSQSNE